MMRAKPCAAEDHTFAAVALDWDTIPATEGADLRLLVEDLCRHGVHVAVVSDAPLAEVDAQLAARPHGPGRLYLAVNEATELHRVRRAGTSPLPGQPALPPAGKAAALQRLRAEFDALGVGPGLLLVPHDGYDGPNRDPLHLLAVQARRHLRLRVPAIDADPRWAISFEGPDRLRHRVEESLLTLASGGIATRGALEEPCEFGSPLVVAAGVYANPGVGLLPGPVWHQVPLDCPPRRYRRTLDLRTGLVFREEIDDGTALRSVRFASLSRPGIVAMRIESNQPVHTTPPGAETWQLATGAGDSGIGALTVDRHNHDGDLHILERLTVLAAETGRTPTRTDAHRQLSPAAEHGFDALLAEQRLEWARRWDVAGITIPGDPEVELRLRFALFHLWNLCSARTELAVGARGLSGSGYSGHVFWDADVFVLPALMTMHPHSARAMVEYRLRRLDAARARAAAEGRTGARFPWESARSGRDVTPRVGWLGSEEVPILTGEFEEHITADVAWSVVRRADWAGEELTTAERHLLAETARYWASRVRFTGDGRAHIDAVIGPDEYHERVDDNAFTNVMARWNLRAAARLAADQATTGEQEAWCRTADMLVDGHDPATGVYEQFAGYFDREPLLVSELGTPPLAADVLAGRERISASQVIKQPDVLMLHELVPDEVAPGSLAANLDYYGPRTAHGSSLAPATTARLLARAGRTDEALGMLALALDVDLADRQGLAAAGLHMAAAAGAWQAVLAGFLGVDVRDGVLHLDPRLPESWHDLEVRFCCLGSQVRLTVHDSQVRIRSSEPLRVRTASGQEAELPGGPTETILEGAISHV